MISKKGSSKIVLMVHRRWLHKDDEWRTHGDLFNNTDDNRGPPSKRPGVEIMEMLMNWEDFPKVRKKIKKSSNKMPLKVWKRKYVF